MSGCEMRDPPCDSEGLVEDSGSTIGNRELIFAEKCVTLPRKDGIITETAEDGVAERQEKYLQCMQQNDSNEKKMKCSANFKFNQQIHHLDRTN